MKLLLFFIILICHIEWAWTKEPLSISTFQTDDVLTEVAQEVIRVAYKRLGENVIFERFPAERGIMSANEGLVWGELYRIEGLEKKYPNLLRVPVPVCYGTLYAFSLDEFSYSIKSWKDLKAHSLAHRLGLKAIEKNTQGYSKYPVADLVQAVQMLKAKRVDFIVDTRTSVEAALKKLNISGIKRHEPALDSMPLFHYIHKKNRRYFIPLKRVLLRMEKEGEIRAITKKVYSNKK